MAAILSLGMSATKIGWWLGLFDKQALLKKCIQPDEKLLVAKVLDQADLSLKKHTVAFTDFFDPSRSETIRRLLLGIEKISFYEYGGSPYNERQMFVIFPDYMQVMPEDFPIMVLKISINIKFSAEPGHRDYMGSVLGLGIDRGKIGDIMVFQGYALCFVKNDIAEYVSMNLLKVGNSKANVEIYNAENVSIPDKKMDTRNTTVSSMRLDSVLGAMFNVSRGKAQEFIAEERVSVNWRVTSSSSVILKEGDVISLRGSGRGKVVEVKGYTKKDRLSLVLGRYV